MNEQIRELIGEQNGKGNSILNKARYSLNNTDEWYTTYETIAEELVHYENGTVLFM